MAIASLNQFQAAVEIMDSPIGYTPPIGNEMRFYINYLQRQNNQPTTFNFSNLGPQWNCNWISYISGGPTNGYLDAVLNAPAGNQFNYGNYAETQVSGGTWVNQGDFLDNDAWTHGTLHYRQNPERYERWMPNGTVETFALSVGTAPNRQFFLTSITDPQGNTTTLNYDPTAAINGQAILTSVIDPLGGKLIFGYNTSNPLQIARVTRSSDGLTATFSYSGGKLTSSRDPMGITSSFHYASGTTFIDRMTTPYGNTTFSSTDTTTSQEADMTNPKGEVQRVEYQFQVATSTLPASETSAPSATGLTIDNTNLNTANSFYWNRRAMAQAASSGYSVDSAAFYGLAHVTHWAQSPLGTIPLALSIKDPLESRIWFNYPNQADADTVDVTVAGADTHPSKVARVLDGGATQLYQASYNVNGGVTQVIDPIGRTTNVTYASNGIDVTQVSQTNGSGQDVLGSLTYNSQHEPLTVTDASGQMTTLTYNSLGQLLTSTNAKSETTTLAYNSNGYLNSVTGPVSGATTTYAYDSANRIHTVTDSEGYVITVAYDNLDRPTTATYPDGTHDQAIYHNLDVAQTIDRQGRSTYGYYDALGQLLQVTDPQGRATWLTWCTCGGLSTITDANGHVTTFGLDLEGRVTSKTYADSSQITCAYETNTSRIHTVTDARGSVSTCSYNVDDTLSGVTYAPGTGVASTPNVSFTYDSVYNRLASMTDGTGTTTYSYNAIPSSGTTTGAGQLHTITSPIAGTTATVGFSYDELGRLTGRGVDTATTNANNVSAVFDALGRITSLTNPLGSFTYAYVNTTSRLSSVTYPSGTGLSTAYAYFNNAGDQNLQTIQNFHGTTNLSKFDFTYNAAGTLATWTQQTDSGTAIVNTLGRDGADQLTSAVQSGGGSASNAYHYDPVGNRLLETTGSGTMAGQFNSVNQLTSFSSSTTATTISGNTSVPIASATINAVPATITSGTNFSASVPLPSGTNIVSFVEQNSAGVTETQRYQMVTSGTAPAALTYDTNGNTLTDEKGYAYTWDALDRLVTITYPSGATSNFIYDGMGRWVSLIEKNSGGTITSTKNFLWIGSQLAEERDASNNVTKRFFPQGEQQAGTSYYYMRDHRGSIREMMDGSGNIVARYSYDPYGRATLISGSNLATFQYAGMYSHATSGLNFTLFRPCYDPNLGRWLQRDPMGEGGGLNLYGYCDNDPVDFSDPFGLCPGDPIGPFGEHINNNPVESFIYDNYMLPLVDDIRKSPTSGDARFNLMMNFALPEVREAEAGAPLLRVAVKGNIHHIATDKNLISTLRGGPWTPRFEAIFKKAGMTLQDAANKVEIPGHVGPHPEAYHQAIFDRLTSATAGLSGLNYKAALDAELKAIAAEAQTPGSALNKLLTQP